MARALLHDDVLPCGQTAQPVEVESVLDDDQQPTTQTCVLPTLTVLRRERTGYPDDGDPVFEWNELVEGPAVLWESRTEVDDVSGVTYVKAKATILYDGDTVVRETTLVKADTGGTFRVEGVAQVPGRLDFVLTRVSDDDDDATGDA